ncbi:MAG: hypothetical protein RLZZ301_890 [Bacteroidota bacterium]
MHIRSPKTEAEWEAYFALRFLVLRAPWGQPQGSERSADEAQHQHLAAFDENQQLIGVGRLDAIDAKRAQIRFMAVLPEYQKNGIGRQLIEALETKAAAQKHTEIVLHAREIALPFYEKLGYQLLEKSHLLFGEIQHYLMQKTVLTHD